MNKIEEFAKWIILIMQENNKELFEPPFRELVDIVVVDEEENLMLFNSLDEASKYQDEHCIDGRCVQLPIY